MTILILAPHTDDAELGCGGTIARMVEEGHAVHVFAFSSCGNTKLLDELIAASNHLGATPSCYNYPVRRFHEHRQDILDDLIRLRENLNPDRVYVPHPHNDIHQDHEVLANEALRAFKYTTMLAYELPWNNITWNSRHFSVLTKAHVERKVEAIAYYTSQQHRQYTSPERMHALAITRGMACGTDYAECFDVLRWIN